MNFFKNPDRIDFMKTVWLIPVIGLLHELEEWNILPWHRKFNTGVPDVTSLQIRTVLVLIGLVYFAWTALSLMPRSRRTRQALLVPLLALLAANGLQHLIWLIQFKTYAPGVVFGFFAGVPVCLYFLWRISREKIMPKWIFVLFGVLVTADIVHTLMLGNELDPKIRTAMVFSKSLSRLIWGR